MKAIFERALHRLTLIPRTGAPLQFEARNNVDSKARGPWPEGTYQADILVPVHGPDGEEGGTYGPWFLRFIVGARTGMGLHAGRAGDQDGLGREGPAHATKGCIRTTAEAMRALAAVVDEEGNLPDLWVC